MIPTDDQLKWKEAADKATPGPWTTGRHPEPDCCVRYVLGPDGMHDEVCTMFRDLDENVANAAFIAISRTAVPALIAAVKELKAELATARSENERLRGEIATYRYELGEKP